MKEQKETVGLAPPGRPREIGVPNTPIIPTLAQVGIDKNLAHRAMTSKRVDADWVGHAR